MTAEAKTSPATKKVGIDVAKSGAKPPYTFRTGWSLFISISFNNLVNRD